MDPSATAAMASLQAKILELEQQLQEAQGTEAKGWTGQKIRPALNQAAAAAGRKKDVWSRFREQIHSRKQPLPEIFKKCVFVCVHVCVYDVEKSVRRSCKCIGACAALGAAPLLHCSAC